MKEKIAKLLIKAAFKISPKTPKEIVEKVENYKANKLAISIFCTKKQLKDFRKEQKLDGISNRKADEMMIYKLKSQVKGAIINSISEKCLIEYDIEKKNDEISVLGTLKVYVKDESSDR